MSDVAVEVEREIERVEEMRREYAALGAPGALGATLLARDLEAARRALKTRETRALVARLASLRGWRGIEG
jgi:hypothetical protein